MCCCQNRSQGLCRPVPFRWNPGFLTLALLQSLARTCKLYKGKQHAKNGKTAWPAVGNLGKWKNLNSSVTAESLRAQPTLTLHQEFSHRLAAVCFDLVVTAVFLSGFVYDQHMLAAIFFKAIFERLVSRQFHSIFLPGTKKFSVESNWIPSNPHSFPEDFVQWCNLQLFETANCGISIK